MLMPRRPTVCPTVHHRGTSWPQVNLSQSDNSPKAVDHDWPLLADRVVFESLLPRASNRITACSSGDHLAG